MCIYAHKHSTNLNKKKINKKKHQLKYLQRNKLEFTIRVYKIKYGIIKSKYYNTNISMHEKQKALYAPFFV